MHDIEVSRLSVSIIMVSHQTFYSAICLLGQDVRAHNISLGHMFWSVKRHREDVFPLKKAVRTDCSSRPYCLFNGLHAHRKVAYKDDNYLQIIEAPLGCAYSS